MDRICNDCGRPFIITKADRAYYFKNRQSILCRCKTCQWKHKDAPLLWYVNKDSGEVESVTVLHGDSESVYFLYRGRERSVNTEAIGSRLFRSYGEAKDAGREQERS